MVNLLNNIVLYKQKMFVSIVNLLENNKLKEVLRDSLNADKHEVAHIVYKALVYQNIISGGHVYINAKDNEWYSKLSATTLGSMKLSNLMLPFNSGTIGFSGLTISYSKFGEGVLYNKFNSLGIKLQSDTDSVESVNQEAIILIMGNVHFPLLTNLTLNENIKLLKKNNPIVKQFDYKKRF